jgi:dihydroflavonol-4-reductase
MILVTGATGFLGRHLIAQLARGDRPVRALVRPQSDAAFLAAYPQVEPFTVSGITDAAGVRAACAGCDAVVHAAAYFRMWGRPGTFVRTNVLGTQTVLGAAQQAGVARVVHVSSIAVVGRPLPGRVVDERHPCDPQDDYQRTKLAAERLALEAAAGGALDVVVVRPGALYGPGGHYAFNRLFFRDPMRGLRIKVEGGRRLIFPAYAPDVAAGAVAALRRGRSGEVYNLSGLPLTHNEVNDIVSDVAGISRRRLNVPTGLVLAFARLLTALAGVTGREPFYPTNLASYVFQDWPVSSQKAERALGFTATPFAEGARATVRWYRQGAPANAMDDAV